MTKYWVLYTFLRERLNRNFIKSLIPPRTEICSKSPGSHTEENLVWENTMAELTLLSLTDPTPKEI